MGGGAEPGVGVGVVAAAGAVVGVVVRSGGGVVVWTVGVQAANRINPTASSANMDLCTIPPEAKFFDCE